jgi:hypothetical protein
MFMICSGWQGWVLPMASTGKGMPQFEFSEVMAGLRYRSAPRRSARILTIASFLLCN